MRTLLDNLLLGTLVVLPLMVVLTLQTAMDAVKDTRPQVIRFRPWLTRAVWLLLGVFAVTVIVRFIVG